MKIAILDDWFDTLRSLPCFAKLRGLEVTVFTDHLTDVNDLAERLEPFDILVLFRERTAITGALLDQLPNLKLISQRSVFPHVDVASCTRNGVLLCSNMRQDGASHAVAELTWALILASMRQIPQQMLHMKNGGWQLGVGRTLYGRSLGLYGYGRVAKSVEGYAKAFGMKVIWWGSEVGRARANADEKIVAPSRESFFNTPDIVSIHVRLTSKTRGIIRAADLAKMRPSSLFVNTSRAGLIEKGAMLASLDKGRPGMAALDVFDKEPITRSDDPLLCHPNVLCTPHIGFVTEDEFELQFSDIFDQINAFKAGYPINMVNPEAVQEYGSS